MLKYMVTVFTVLLVCFSGCVTTPASTSTPKQDRLSFNSIPMGGELVFVGVSSTTSNPKESVQYAVEDAARRVAIYYGVSGKVISFTNRSRVFMEYDTNTEAVLTGYDLDYKRYVEDLSFDEETDVVRNERAVFVYTRYNGSLRSPVLLTSLSKDAARPEWVDDMSLGSRFPGYIAAVGYAGRRAAQSDTIKASYNNAIFSLLVDTSAMILGDQSDKSDGTGSNQYTVYANGSLTGFYVLDTWVDPTTKGVYTLAIARDPTL
jgi:hypothetical protein